MERKDALNIQQILLFSNVLRVLSYYSYLDQWKRVMMRLWKLSRDQWREHEVAFIFYGKELKRNIYIKSKAASNIQMLLWDKQLFNQMLLKRDNFQIYLGDILLKLNSKQELIMHQYKDNLKYLVMYIWEDDESTLILPALKWVEHIQNLHSIKQSQMPNFIKSVKNMMDLNAIAIKYLNKICQIKVVLSPVVRINATLQDKILINYSKAEKLRLKNWLWYPCTFICEYDHLYDSGNFWRFLWFKDVVNQVIFILQKPLVPYYLDFCYLLHNLKFPTIEIKNQNCK